MSLSYTLYEQLILDEGMVMNPSFADYKLPTSLEIPEIEVFFVGDPDPSGPFGAKGVGEHGCIPTVAAIANAIYDAVGARLYELPLSPDKVLSAIDSRKTNRNQFMEEPISFSHRRTLIAFPTSILGRVLVINDLDLGIEKQYVVQISGKFLGQNSTAVSLTILLPRFDENSHFVGHVLGENLNSVL